MPRWALVCVIAAVVLGIFFRFYHLDRKVYWEDELFGTVHMLGYTESEIVAHSADLTDGAAVQAYFHLPGRGSATPDSLASTVHSLAVEDSQHPPLYYVLGHLWVEVFGSSAEAIRALSAVVAVLAIPAGFWLAFELFGTRPTAWTMAALVALSPFDVLYAQEAREYALWTVVMLATSALFLRACRVNTRSAWAGYALGVTIGCYVYPLTLLTVACYGAFLLSLAELRTRKVLLPYVISTAVAVALFAPWLRLIVLDLWETRGVPRGMAVLMQSHLSAGQIALTFLRNMRQVFLDFGRFQVAHLSSTAINFLLTVAVAALLGLAFVFLWRRAPARASHFITFGLALSAVPLLFHDLAFGGKLVDQSRYFIPVYIAAQLAVAALLAMNGFEGLGSRRVWAPALVLVLGGEALSCAISSQAQTWWNKDYEVSRDVAAVVNASPGALVVSDYTTSRTLGLGYYLAPTVPLRVRLRCDLCRNTAPGAGSDLLRGDEHFAHVFLLQPNPGNAVPDSRYRYIGVSVFSPTPTALGMFLPI